MQVDRQQTGSNPRHEGVGRLRILIGSAVAVAMLLVAMPAIAHDYTGHGDLGYAPANCTSGRLCVYADTGKTGGYAQFNGSNTDWSCCPSAEDNDESAYNNGTTGRTVTVYSLTNYNGFVQYCLQLGHGINNLYAIYHANNGDSNRWLWDDC